MTKEQTIRRNYMSAVVELVKTEPLPSDALVSRITAVRL